MASLHIQGRTSFAEVDLVRKDPLIKKGLPMDNSRTKKEGVGRIQRDGCYAPIFSYIAEGYMCSCELRPGTQHCQKEHYLEKTHGYRYLNRFIKLSKNLIDENYYQASSFTK